MMDSEVLFRQLLAVAKQREVNQEQVLSHELAPVPPSLSLKVNLNWCG